MTGPPGKDRRARDARRRAQAEEEERRARVVAVLHAERPRESAVCDCAQGDPAEHEICLACGDDVPGCECDCNLARAIVAALGPVDQPEASDPESTCRRCRGPNVSWSAPSPLWNAVMRGGSINGEWEYDELICPTCFAELAEERGIASAWRLAAGVVNVELETVTPSGRVWDASQWLWVEPVERPEFAVDRVVVANLIEQVERHIEVKENRPFKIRPQLLLAALGPVERPCEVTDAMVEAGLQRWLAGASDLARLPANQVVRAILEAALGAVVEGDAR